MRWLRRCCITLLALTFYFQASPLHAIELYYVELGRFPNESKATQNWQQLLDDQTSLLDELEPYPRPVIHEGRQVLFHLYAGPLEGKQEATKLCQRLFDINIPCFVVEGMPVDMHSQQAQLDAPPTLPWLVEEEEKNKQHQRQQALLPWVVASPEILTVVTVNKPPTIQVADAEDSADMRLPTPVPTKIQVAEAVRVSLSDLSPASAPFIRSESKSENAGYVVFRVRVLTPSVTDDELKHWVSLFYQTHSDLIDGIETTFKPAEGDSQAAIFLGSYATSEEALQLCYVLRQRGVYCQIEGSS
jgi:hypothetical protein